MSQVFFKSVCRYRTSNAQRCRRRVTSVCRLQHVQEHRVPIAAVVWRCRISL